MYTYNPRINTDPFIKVLYVDKVLHKWRLDRIAPITGVSHVSAVENMAVSFPVLWEKKQTAVAQYFCDSSFLNVRS